jgi:hypothetical protein
MMVAELLPCDQDPSFWPLVPFIIFGIPVTKLFFREARNPEATIRRIAEQRAKSRLLGWMGDSRDPDEQFRQQWKLRWLGPLAVGGYWLAVLLGLASAVKCR